MLKAIWSCALITSHITYEYCLFQRPLHFQSSSCNFTTAPRTQLSLKFSYFMSCTCTNYMRTVTSWGLGIVPHEIHRHTEKISLKFFNISKKLVLLSISGS